MADYIYNLRRRIRCVTNQKKSFSNVAEFTEKMRIDPTMIF